MNSTMPKTVIRKQQRNTQEAIPPWIRAWGTIMVFLFIVLGWIVSNILQVVCLVFLFPWTSHYQRIRVTGFIFRTLNVCVIRFLNPFWTLHIDDTQLPSKKSTQPNKKVIYMINHESNADPWIAAAVLWPQEAKWVSKGVLFKVPFGGWGMRMGGDIEVKFTKDRDGWGTKKGSVRSMMKYCARLVEHGIPIAAFPEGVRKFVPSPTLQEFKPGFFTFAITEKCDIIPVVLKNTHQAWPTGDWKFDQAMIFCSIGERIDATEFSQDQVHELMSTVRNVMQRQWDSLGNNH